MGTGACGTARRAGRRETFPRDKTCGDGLVPDALGALDTMGLRETVMREAVEPRALHVVAPGGESVSLAGEFLCLTRLRLDALLVDAAVGAGAALMGPMSALQPIEDGRQVCGARFRALAGEREVRARFTLLATGANAVVSRAFGLATPLKPNAVAGRAYFNVPSSFAERFPHLSIVLPTSLCVPATGRFPGPGNRYSVGVGTFAGGHGETPTCAGSESIHDPLRASGRAGGAVRSAHGIPRRAAAHRPAERDARTAGPAGAR